MPRIFLRVILFFIFLEFFFRAGIIATAWIQDVENYAHKVQGEYRILCLGDSLTYEGGNDSYPRQLERLLNEKWAQARVSVLNKAIAGGDSALIVQNVPFWIKEYEPQMVIVMMGLQDPLDKSLNKFERFISGFKTFGLIRKLTLNARDYLVSRYGAGSKTRPDIEYVWTDTEKERDIPPDIIAAINRKPRNFRELYLAGLIAEAKKDFSSTEVIFRRLIEESPEPRLKNWLRRPWAESLRLQEKHTDYLAVVREELEFNPHESWVSNKAWQECRYAQAGEGMTALLKEFAAREPENAVFPQLLGACYEETGNAQAAREQFELARKLRGQRVNSLTRKNYASLIATLNEHRIRPVVMQYPLRDTADLKAMINGLEGEKNIIVIDNETVFRRALSTGTYGDYFKDRYGGDFGHLTVRGHELIARNLAENIARTLR